MPKTSASSRLLHRAMSLTFSIASTSSMSTSMPMRFGVFERGLYRIRHALDG